MPGDNIDIITASLNEMLRYAKKRSNFQSGDKVNLIVNNPKFFHAISTGYQADNHVEKLKDKMLQILTSDESVNLTE